MSADTRVFVDRCLIQICSMSWFGKFNVTSWTTWREKQKKKKIKQEPFC